jgi:hypothetical protein
LQPSSEKTLDLLRQEELNHDKPKYREMLLETTETVLGYFGFDRTIYDAESARKTNRKWWYELAEEQSRDIERKNMKTELI